MKKALIGNGGHAREIMFQMNDVLPRFVDDAFYNFEENTFKLSDFNPDEFQVLVAIGDSLVRNEVVKKLPTQTKYFTFIHPSAFIGTDSQIGDGSFIGMYSIVTTNIKIGKHSLLNRCNQIGHDTQIGDYCSIMPGAVISGNCFIGNNCYFGTNSSIRENIKITDNVIIGLNSGVVKNINESGVYGGTPIKKIK